MCNILRTEISLPAIIVSVACILTERTDCREEQKMICSAFNFMPSGGLRLRLQPARAGIAQRCRGFMEILT
jgi:hypothetical protein